MGMAAIHEKNLQLSSAARTQAPPNVGTGSIVNRPPPPVASLPRRQQSTAVQLACRASIVFVIRPYTFASFTAQVKEDRTYEENRDAGKCANLVLSCFLTLFLLGRVTFSDL
jgi:hypothetical protein